MKTFQFKATGNISSTRGDDPKPSPTGFNGPFSYSVAVDVPGKRMRFDHEAKLSTHQESVVVNRLVRLPDRSLVYRAEGDGLQHSAIDIMAPDYHISSEMRLFDIRSLGVTYSPVPSSATYESHFDSLLTPEWMGRIVDVRQEGKGIVSIEWKIDYGQEQRQGIQRLFINEDAGFTPIRFVNYMFDVISKKWLDQPTGQSDVTWKQINSTWVPDTFRWEYIPPPEAPANREVLHMAFEWLRVNEPLPEVLFTPEGLEAAPDTLVADSRSGHAIDEGTIAERRDQPASLTTHHRTSSWRTWAMFVGGGVLFLLSAFLWRRPR